MEAFFATKTYAGLLEGRPNASLNTEILNKYPEIPHRIWPQEPVVLLGHDSYKIRIDDPLPPVMCSAHFISYQPGSETAKMGSSLVVTWFQTEMTPTWDEQNVKWIRAIDWNHLARNFDW